MADDTITTFELNQFVRRLDLTVHFEFDFNRVNNVTALIHSASSIHSH